MGYLHILNLYKDQTILLFKECYALEKIHGTSSHVGWNHSEKKIYFFSGGENHKKFIDLFDADFLRNRFEELFPDISVTIFGEAYGGKQQGMSKTYGANLKFIVFDVKIGGCWLSVPNAEKVCGDFNLEFVHYDKIEATIENINKCRDDYSVQALRNGITEPKIREGVVLRPLVELTLNNGSRVIAKHKREEFSENKTTKNVNTEELAILENATQIANEWVTPNRLEHVLQKFADDVNIESMGDIIKAMIEDVYREGKDEIVESKNTEKAIGRLTVKLFKKRLENKLHTS